MVFYLSWGSEMVRKILGAVGLFISLYGYGIMMQPRQTYLTATRARASLSSLILGLVAVGSVLLLSTSPAKGED